MQVSTNGEYNPIQLNETINLSPDGKVFSRSLMLNLRGETAKEVWNSYQELKKLVEGREDKPEKKVKQEKKEKTETPNCPKCKTPMIIRTNGKTGAPFWSCPQWPICNGTRPFESEKEKKRLESIPCDQDLIESIPF